MIDALSGKLDCALDVCFLKTGCPLKTPALGTVACLLGVQLDAEAVCPAECPGRSAMDRFLLMAGMAVYFGNI